MKNIIVFLIMTVSAIASPLWNHPNVQAATPAPINGEYYTLDLLQLQGQSPQNGIFYAGGVVGYFANEWKLPVWTTPQVIPPSEFPWVFDDEKWDDKPKGPKPPVVVPPVVVPPIVVPPIHPHSHDPFCPPAGSDVPEPATYAMIGVGLVALAFVRGRGERKR